MRANSLLIVHIVRSHFGDLAECKTRRTCLNWQLFDAFAESWSDGEQLVEKIELPGLRPEGRAELGYAVADRCAWMNASKSALIVVASVVGMPCGNPL